MNTIPVRLGLMQRVLPGYRIPFFEMLAGACPHGFSLFSGQARPEEAIQSAMIPDTLRSFAAQNRHMNRGRFYLCRQAGLEDWLTRWDPRVLIAEANPRYLSTPKAVRWMHALDRPVIGWGLGAPAGNGFASSFRRAFWRAYLRQYDALITYSQTGRDQYIQAGFPAERIFIAPNAVAPKPVQTAAERGASLPDGQANVLFVGRLQARKRVDVLLRACALLPEPLQPRLCIVGEGPEKSALEDLARTIYPAAEFAGAKYGPQLEPFFRQADVFVLPGTGGLAVQQAMAHSLPVIVGEADGTQADLVRPGNGVLVEPGSAETLCAALQNLLADPVRMREMGRESFRIAAEEINLEHMVEVFARAVQAVLEA